MITTQRRDLHDARAIAFFGAWMVIGLYLDGWAHNAEKPETFFSPWHFILYSGFGAAVAYFTFRGAILKKRSDPDRLTTVGLVLFIVGAVGDGVWHEIFGIEVDLEALLSPTHLALMIGGLMMLGIAYRGAERADPREDRADISLVVTMTLGAAVVMFFTQYFNAFRFEGLWPAPRGEDIWEVHAVGSVFVTNAILLGMVFLLVRRWRTPRWTFALSFAALATANVALDGREGEWFHVPAAAIAGAVTDVLARRVRPNLDDARPGRLFSVLVPLVVWSLWFLTLQIGGDGVHWAAELWTGTIILAVLQGTALGLLAFPTPERSGPLLPPAPDGPDEAIRPVMT